MIIQLVRKAKKMFAVQASAADQRNEYYFKKIYFKRISHFFRAYKTAVENGTIKNTSATINPLGLTFGSSVATVEKILSKPKYQYKNAANKHQVIFYRQAFTDISLLIQVQFYNNKLIFIGIDVLKRVIDEVEKTEIINTVIEKYLNVPYQKDEALPLLQDADNNFIYINDDINFSICYVSGMLDEEKQEMINCSVENDLEKKPEKGKLFYAF